MDNPNDFKILKIIKYWPFIYLFISHSERFFENEFRLIQISIR